MLLRHYCSLIVTHLSVLQAENRRLKEELEHMASEALAAAADLRNSKAIMQREVWSSKDELRASREGMQVHRHCCSYAVLLRCL